MAVQTPMYSSSIHASFLMHISSSINAYLSIGYATERVLATVMVKRYENQRPFYGFAFTALLLCLTLYNAVSDNYLRTDTLQSGFSMSTIITTYGTNGIGIICLMVVCLLHRYNRRRYFADFHKGTFGHLSGRYQNLENIRTTRQLIPVIFFHILAGLNGSLFVTGMLFFPLTPDDIFYRLMFNNVANCSIYLLCQAAVLHFHPVLRMDTYAFLRRTLCCRICRLQGTGRVTPLDRPTGIVVEKAAATPGEEGSVYFQTLADAWDRQYDTNLAQRK
ncbi:hypothetical protein AAVH_21071 [Aphelenchoides avenae]|nr:hypothetical protein AAVH_21071 [Aphelenchus avenae]